MWDYAPNVGFTIEYETPPTLVSVFEDGSVSIREKTTTTKSVYVGTYTVNRQTAAEMLAYFDLVRLTTAFLLRAFDPRDLVDPDQALLSVRFVERPHVEYVSARLVRLTCRFREA